LTHLDRVGVDADLALSQWRGYVDAFRAHGWDVVEVEPADEHPDGVFVEDAVVVFSGVAVLMSPGAESRRGEVATVAAALDCVPVDVRRIETPGTLDGGDVSRSGARSTSGGPPGPTTPVSRSCARSWSPRGGRSSPCP
jgi:dimethylargininase